MKIRMLESRPGSPDGVTVQWYPKGEEFLFDTPGGQDLGAVFVREGWAKLVESKALPGAPDNKDLGAAPANKTRPGGAGRARSAA